MALEGSAPESFPCFGWNWRRAKLRLRFRNPLLPQSCDFYFTAFALLIVQLPEDPYGHPIKAVADHLLQCGEML
jgi:hypothetical protein